MQASQKNNDKFHTSTKAEAESTKQRRLITAAALITVLVPAVIFLPLVGFMLLFGVIILAAAWEWGDLAGLESKAGRWGFCLAILSCMAGYKLWLGYLFPWLVWPVLAWWLMLAVAMRRIPGKLLNWHYSKAAKVAVGFFVLLSSWIVFVWLRVNFGAMQVLYLLTLVAVADSAAYYVGKNWGFTKLLPEISPGKTVEGLYGALGGALLLALCVGVYFYLFAVKWDGMAYADFVLLSLMTVLLSVCGDLFESLVKRLRGVKDSGSWVPGHGGVLDRIDSLLAAAPLFYAGCTLRGIFFQ